MYTLTILIIYLLLTVYTFIISETNRTMYQLNWTELKTATVKTAMKGVEKVGLVEDKGYI